MDYSEHTVADLVADDFFIQWVKEPTALSNQYWTNWLHENPDKKEIVEEAQELVLLLAEDEDSIEEWELDVMWQNIREVQSETNVQHNISTRVVPLRFWEKRRVLVAAAVGLMLAVSGICFFRLIHDNTPVVYATRYGETQTVKLPDNSVVVLNANSTLTIPAADWSSGSPREVTLRGEAYFSVTHKVNNQKFVVHVSDDVEVEVVGTEFNVSNRGNTNKVVLSAGKVLLNIACTGKSKRIAMAPGELVEVAGKDKAVVKKEVDTELYTSWKDNKLAFNNTTLREIAAVLQENYGYAVVFQDADVANQKVTAFLDAGNLSDVLFTLSETLGVKITLKDKKIIMISNH